MPTEDLFAAGREEAARAQAPLPARMRPRELSEVVGQQHLLSEGAAFRSMVEMGKLTSLILWGPPGSGKTTLARLISRSTGAHFEQLSATNAGVKDVREVLARAAQRLGEGRGRTVLFLDEIHRFSKSQQDALLPGVEDGVVILVGATTENPFFEVNSPLISRATVFRTEPLAPEEIADLVERAASDTMRGIGMPIDEDAREALAQRVGGDARLALNALEMAATIAEGKGSPVVTEECVAEALQRRIIRYDRTGDRHYDIISAFIKSMRGSDPDAAVYWLQTMIEAGEDPKFVARRMVIFASEDVGLADPSALEVALNAFRAVEVVGLPEANYALTHATLHLALAPKSNSVALAIRAGAEAVQGGAPGEVPAHLRSGATAGEKAMGIGVGYVYPHDAPAGVVPQQYLPDGHESLIVYRPRRVGDETEVAERVRRIDAILGKPERSVPP
ncbi:MAG: replication-associated recombination protein A [Actinomycetota bacterium]|nr:replication-associated recombination protein A [Actinomycetota bacterium]